MRGERGPGLTKWLRGDWECVSQSPASWLALNSVPRLELILELAVKEGGVQQEEEYLTTDSTPFSSCQWMRGQTTPGDRVHYTVDIIQAKILARS